MLQIAAAPVNWPIGDGDRFKGVYDLRRNQVLLYERTLHNARRAEIEVSSIEDPALSDLIGEDAAAHLRESAALVAQAGTQVDHEAYLRAEQTPVFFGSALSNFGLEPFLRGLTEFAPPPQPRPVDRPASVDPADPDFSGFVFKIQANMNPRHRDRIAFVRVCSGVLSKDMQVTNTRLNAPLRLSRPNRFFGRERETVDSAVAGDVVGLVNPGRFAIGDTLWAGKKLAYPPIPHFAAEFFGRRAPARHALQAVRGRRPPARGRRPDAGGLPDLRPARADPRRGRRAAVRRRRGAAQERVRRRVRHRSPEVLDRPLGEVARGHDRPS